jgi:hypothetical protein
MKKGDKVKWNLRNDEAKDIITKIQTIDFVFMNRQRRASDDNPQYEVVIVKKERLPCTKFQLSKRYCTS